MTKAMLQAKNGKQLRTFLYHYGWNKKDIQEMLREIPTEMTGEALDIVNFVIETWTFEHLLELYHEEVVDYIWEEICNA